MKKSVIHIGVCCVLSRVRLFVTPWTVAHRPLCPWGFPGRNAGVGAVSSSRFTLVPISMLLFPPTLSSLALASDFILCLSLSLLLSLFLTENTIYTSYHQGFHGGSDGKESAFNSGHLGLIPGSTRIVFPCFAV